jgi:hypothetical protein
VYCEQDVYNEVGFIKNFSRSSSGSAGHLTPTVHLLMHGVSTFHATKGFTLCKMMWHGVIGVVGIDSGLFGKSFMR